MITLPPRIGAGKPLDQVLSEGEARRRDQEQRCAAWRERRRRRLRRMFAWGCGCGLVTWLLLRFALGSSWIAVGIGSVAMGAAWWLTAYGDRHMPLSMIIVNVVNAVVFFTLWLGLGLAFGAGGAGAGIGAAGAFIMLFSIFLSWSVIGGVLGVSNQSWERSQLEI